MIRYTLTVPVYLNDGTRVPNRWTVKLERDIADIMGGFTRLDGFGGWLGAGVTREGNRKLYREPISVYQVDSGDPFAPTLMEGFAHRVKSELEQECVYLTRQDISVTLV